MVGNRTDPDIPRSPEQSEVPAPDQGDITIVIPQARRGDAFNFPERLDSKRTQIPKRIAQWMAVLIASITLGAGAGLLAAQLLSQAQPPRPNGLGIQRSEIPGPVVPEVAGLSAAEARSLLLDSNLRVVGVFPTPGDPGVVVHARPDSGRSVTPGTGVILFVGVDPARFEEESDGR